MAYVSKGLPSIAKPLLSRTGDYTPAVREATAKLKGAPKAPHGGDIGFMRAGVAQSGVKASRLSAGSERSNLIATGRQDKKNANAVLNASRVSPTPT